MVLRHAKMNHKASAELNPNFWTEMDKRGLTPNPEKEEKLLARFHTIEASHSPEAEFKAKGDNLDVCMVTGAKFHEVVKSIEKSVKYQLFK